VAAVNGVIVPNDSDPDGDPLVVTQVSNGGTTVAAGASITGTNGGTFVINANGSYTFTPGAAFQNLPVGQSRNTAVTYTISDGQGGTASASLTITVTGVNDNPTSTPIGNQNNQDSNFVSVNASGSFSDVDAGEALTFSSSGLPAGLSINSGSGVI